MHDPIQTRPRAVTYVVASMIVGGTQTHLLQVFRFLDRARYRPSLVCLRDRGDLIDSARALDVPVRTMGMRGSLRYPGDAAGLLRLRKLLHEQRPDVVHGYLLRGNFFGAIAAKAARVPVLVTSKRGLHQPAGLAERIAVRASNALSAAVTANSPAVVEFTRRVEAATTTRIEMIPSGIDTERFDPSVAVDLRTQLGLGDAPVVGTAITWRPRKGFRMLFEAFAEIRRRLPTARLLLAGVDSWSGDPQRVASELDILDATVLLGRRSDMPDVLATLDVFVLPSESEGMSNAVLEAMAMGLPVVATAVGGNPVVIEEGQTGFLVSYPDAPALADRVMRLLQDRGMAERMGLAGRHRVIEGYSAFSMVRQMEDLYDRLLAERR